MKQGRVRRRVHGTHPHGARITDSVIVGTKPYIIIHVVKYRLRLCEASALTCTLSVLDAHTATANGVFLRINCETVRTF